jgi:nucleotide-binding universal stress UspA family protein
MSSPIQKILYPTDFSKPSEAIAGHVAGLANVLGARTRLLNVAPLLADFHGVSEGYFGPFTEQAILKLEEQRKAMEAEGRRRLEELRKRHFDPDRTEICVQSSGVAEAIVESAKEFKADLIMMSTRGHGPTRRFLIGAVAAKVLHDATCPVWTSPHPRELEPFRPYRHILLAIDRRWWPEDLLVRSAELANAFQAKLSVISALPSNGIPGDEMVRKSARELAAALRGQIAKLNITAEVHVMEGNPGDVVRQAAEETENADLIVTGRGHLSEPMGHLRTHAYEIIWEAPCPVITM